MNTLEKQIQSTFQKAFFDLLQEKVAQTPPDYDWLSRLYEEIKLKLVSLLRKDHPLRKEIEESMDIDLFKQMLVHGAFESSDFLTLINYVFGKCKQLQSPARDSHTDKKLQEILDHVQTTDATFSSIVPLFIKNANECIDFIYEDIRNLKK